MNSGVHSMILVTAGSSPGSGTLYRTSWPDTSKGCTTNCEVLGSAANPKRASSKSSSRLGEGPTVSSPNASQVKAPNATIGSISPTRLLVCTTYVPYPSGLVLITSVAHQRLSACLFTERCNPWLFTKTSCSELENPLKPGPAPPGDSLTPH